MEQISKTAWQRSKQDPTQVIVAQLSRNPWGAARSTSLPSNPLQGLLAQLTLLLSSSWAPPDFLGSSRFPGLLPAGGQIISEHRLFIWVPVHSLTPAGRALLPAVPRILLLLDLPLLHFPLNQ